jgi:hypothetical protein
VSAKWDRAFRTLFVRTLTESEVRAIAREEILRHDRESARTTARKVVDVLRESEDRVPLGAHEREEHVGVGEVGARSVGERVELGAVAVKRGADGFDSGHEVSPSVSGATGIALSVGTVGDSAGVADVPSGAAPAPPVIDRPPA